MLVIYYIIYSFIVNLAGQKTPWFRNLSSRPPLSQLCRHRRRAQRRRRRSKLVRTTQSLELPALRVPSLMLGTGVCSGEDSTDDDARFELDSPAIPTSGHTRRRK